jgi:fumarate reductase flavoprotein subunit
MKREISRRDFMKGTAAGALGLAATSLLGGLTAGAEETVAEPSPEETTVEPGVKGSYQISTIIDTEAVVVGCGAAGIQAALTLQADGISTYLLEKGLGCGVSNGSVAGGPALAETSVQEAEDATVSVETLYNCQFGFSRGTVNGALLHKCIEQGGRVVSNFMDNGVNMGLRRDAYGMGFRARHNFANTEGVQVKGVDRFQPLVDKFTADGGVFEPNREGVALVKTGDAVTGIIVKNTEDNSYIQYNAKAVLIATGGFAGNDARLREHFGDMEIYPMCNTLSDGKGYDMVIAAGGIADRNWALCCNEFGGVNPKIQGASGSGMAKANAAEVFAIYGGLLVNAEGSRFMDEHYMSDRPLALGGEMTLREGKFYAVIDQDMYEGCRDEGIFAYLGSPKDWYVGSTGLVDSDGNATKLENLDEQMETAISEGWAFKGTLAECAEAFHLSKLEDTVAAYNALCESGEDTDFYKPSYLLKSMPSDTFYVIEYIPSIWCTFGGVKTDAYCRALTKAQEPIPGLYVAGVDNGSLYASPYYENEGAALGTAYTSGIVAGDCMVDYIKSL